MDQLINFKFSHAQLGNMQERLIVRTGQVSAKMPVLDRLRDVLVADGYTFDSKPISIDQSDRSGVITYSVLGQFGFIKNDGRLIFGIRSAEYADINDAIRNATQSVTWLRYNGVPIAMGKGQLNKCKEIALRLIDEHGHHLEDSSMIYVDYETRGGRGGWKSKVADRRWTKKELLTPEPKQKRNSVRIDNLEWWSWANKWTKHSPVMFELQSDGKVKHRWNVYNAAIDGDFVILGRSSAEYRFPLADWDRLKKKAGVQ